MDGVAGRERAGHMGAAALVGEEPEVEFGEEAGEVGEGGGGWGGEGFDPEVGADLDWVLFEEGVGVLVVVQRRRGGEG